MADVPDTLTVTFLYVGQGNSILVQSPNGRAMLVDAGESWAAKAVAAGLEAEDITRLEYVVATHDHVDRVGGLTAVLLLVTVGQFVSSGVPASTVTATNLRSDLSSRRIPTDAATAGETLALDPVNVAVTVLNPAVTPGTDQNEALVVLRLVLGSQSFLLAGDGVPVTGNGASSPQTWSRHPGGLSRGALAGRGQQGDRRRPGFLVGRWRRRTRPRR